jgi:hypothetical protein
MTQEALKLALEALKWANKEINEWREDAYGYDAKDQPTIMSAVNAINEALAKTEQEPVAYAIKEDFHRELERRLKHIREEMKIKSVTMRCKDYDIALPIIDTDFGRVLVGQVSTPPQRTWVGLTDEERKDLCRWWSSPIDAIYATEARLKELNT